MFKLFVTDAGVSKGFDGNPALRFYDGENGGQSVRFRIGKKVFDSRAKDNHRWVNIGVKAFGESCERIKKMKLKEGSYVNIIGRYDEETWEDQNTHEKRSAPVLIVDEIEYCSGGGQKSGKESGGSTPGTPETDPSAQDAPEKPEAPATGAMPDNFTGFEGFGGGGNPFF